MKNEKAVGDVIKIEDQATGHSAGDLLIYNYFPGIVVKDIIGNTEALTILGGKPITGALGDGEGDLKIEGIFKLVDEEASALTAGALVSRASASGVEADTGSNRVGHVVTPRYTEDLIDYVEVKLLGRPYQA